MGLVEVALTTAGTVRSEGAVTRTLALSADGAPVGTRSLTVPSAPTAHLLRLSLPGAAQLEARLLGEDAWPGDDGVRAPIPQVPPVQVLLVTERPQGFAVAALSSHPNVALAVAAPADLPGLPPRADPWDLLVIEPTATAEAALPEARRRVLLGVPDPSRGIRHARAVTLPEMRIQDPLAPMLRYTALERLHIARGWTLEAPADATILLASAQGPLAVQTDALLALGFDPEDSDLVLRAAFVHLLANAVAWAAPPPPPTPPPEGVRSVRESQAVGQGQPSISSSSPLGDGWTWGVGVAGLLAALLMLAEIPLRPAATVRGERRP